MSLYSSVDHCSLICTISTDVIMFLLSCLGREITFPTEYPTSCLLGSVEVLDCLSQDEYRVQVSLLGSI